jgi:hypothetical protein
LIGTFPDNRPAEMNACRKMGDQRRAIMKDLLMLVIVVAVWFFVQWWLLPRLGIST